MPTIADEFRVVRPVVAFVALICLVTHAGHAQPFRVATWQVPDMASEKFATNATAAGADPLAEIAATLGGLEADAIVLYGVSDGQVLRRIGDAMKPKRHSVALHLVHRNGGSKGPIVGEPVAILSARQKLHSKTFEWSDSGRIDMPGGFGFATFKHGPSVVAVYVAGLPGSLTNLTNSGDRDYISRKRDYAAQYVTAHIGWLTTTYTNSVFATYLTGDINPSSKRFLKDDCVAILEKAGFRTFLQGAAVDKSAFPVTNTTGMNRVLDPVFTKSVEFIASRQIDRPAPEHPVVVCDLTLKAPGVAAAPAPTSRRTGSAPKPVVVPEPPKPAPATEATIPLALIETPRVEQRKPSTSAAVVKAPPTALSPGPAEDARSTSTAALSGATVSPTFANWPLIRERWFAPAIAAAGVALMGAVFFFARATRRRQPSLAVSPRPGDAVFVEVRPSDDSLEDLDPVSAGAVVSEATTATDNAHNVHHALWRDPRVDFGNQEHADPVRAGLLAHLRHLMREKLFVWLSKERSHLIDSHETGTRQVLGLEERLEKIKEQFQDRLISQEERIAELDRELQAKDKVIRTVMGEKIRETDGS